jgi:hypothetical protein
MSLKRWKCHAEVEVPTEFRFLKRLDEIYPEKWDRWLVHLIPNFGHLSKPVVEDIKVFVRILLQEDGGRFTNRFLDGVMLDSPLPPGPISFGGGLLCFKEWEVFVTLSYKRGEISLMLCGGVELTKECTVLARHRVQLEGSIALLHRVLIRGRMPVPHIT